MCMFSWRLPTYSHHGSWAILDKIGLDYRVSYTTTEELDHGVMRGMHWVVGMALLSSTVSYMVLNAYRLADQFKIRAIFSNNLTTIERVSWPTIWQCAMNLHLRELIMASLFHSDGNGFKPAKGAIQIWQTAKGTDEQKQARIEACKYQSNVLAGWWQHSVTYTCVSSLAQW